MPVALVIFLVYDVSVIAPAPQNLSVSPWLNGMVLQWNKPACHPTSGNKIVGYNYFRTVGTSTWTHSSCERGIPPSSGLTYLGSTLSENDTTGYDFTITSFTNGTTVSYAVYAVFSDCSESYASSVSSNQVSIGIDEKMKNSYSANLFPNPGSGIFNLDLISSKKGFFTIELLDVNGRQLKKINTTFVSDKASLEFDIKEFDNGYYILKIEDEGRNCSYKPLIKL